MFTQRNEESESEVDVDDFNFDDELESDEVAYGYQFVQRFPAQQNYVEDMRGNGRYYLNMKHLKGRLDMFWVLLDNKSTVHIFGTLCFWLMFVRRLSI